ncbi:hypothetical protein ACS0TY_013597 [Phlomoides rotata]
MVRTSTRCQMISAILHSAKFSVLINGVPRGYFDCSRGVRHGDPISPLLFCLAKEALGRWIDWELSSGRLVQIPRTPRYLFYADDILIFAKATIGNIRRLQDVLSAYGGLSGQIYNPAKSTVYYGTAITRRVWRMMLRTIGISHGSLLLTPNIIYRR